MHGCEVRIEAAITRPILKASVMQQGKDVKERIIIFPYINSRLIEEKYLRARFPLAYRYLSGHKKILLGRDKGQFDAARWYAFGREFGLTTTFGDKLLTSVMNKKPNFQKCWDPEYTFYSGYCIKPKTKLDIDKLLLTLNSDDMDFYIRHTSRDYQNGWKSYAKSFIQDYGIPAAMAGRLTAI
ncbi:Mobile element protein [uncultured Candidatus Thioglobus sp.]|nr:Mobile element protein [uncultured Candidatus Thioglobus sp.]